MATPANAFAFSDLVSNTILAEFNMQRAFLATGNRELTSDFRNNFYRPGQTVAVRRRNKFKVQRGDTVTTEGIVEQTENVTVQELYSVPLDFSSFDDTLEMSDYNERIVTSAINELIGQIERDIGTAALTQVYQATGTPGTAVNSFVAVDGAATFLVERDIPTSPMNLALRPRDASALKGALQNSFNPTLNEDISFGSRLGSLSFTDIFMSNGIARQNNGTITSAVINGAVGSGSTLVMDGADVSAGTIKAGTILEIAGVNSVTNIGRADTGQKLQVVVQVDATATSGAITVTISPSIISDTANPQRNVTNAIPDNAVVTVIASHNANMCYHDSGLSVITLPQKMLPVPFCKMEHDKDTGIYVRTSMDGDVLHNLAIMRIDVMIAYAWHPQYALRVMS
jgi:hypothetical protein